MYRGVGLYETIRAGNAGSGARIALLTVCLASAGCSSLLRAPSTGVGDAAAGAAANGAAQAMIDAADANREALQPSRPFEPETLYNLLIGELSVYNRDIRTAAEFYHREALRTREPQVVSRAAKLARYLRDSVMALELGQLWYEVEPANQQAAENLADLYTRTNQPLRALDVLEQQMQQGGQPRFGLLRNNNLQPGSPELAEVLRRLDTLSASAGTEENFSLLFTHALLLQKNGDNASALAQLQKLRGFDGDPVQLAIIESQLQAELGDDKAASSVLRKALRKNPDDHTLKLAYARRLTKTDLPRAEKMFAELVREKPDDVTLLKSHALIAAENGNYDDAKSSLQSLLDSNREKSFVNYNLGLIAAAETQPALAIGYFEQVRPGDYYLPATQKLVHLLSERGQLQQARDYLASLRMNHPRHATRFWKLESDLLRDRDNIVEAHRVLSLAIAQQPNDAELRFERSLLSEKLDDLELVERDLRYVLEREPNNPVALNALGYVLADRTTRYAEALQLIERAIAIKPDDAAILDSLGWALFRLGRYDEALEKLQRAFDKFPDDEIAAHLIEVHWARNDHKQALRVYKMVRKQLEQHPLSDRVVERLQLLP